jgi:glyoxylase-like metal-dependent hydrolase (beta-lactamase superfamily II)
MSMANGQQPAMPQGAWPTETYTTPERKLYFNNEGVLMIHIPAAHTDGDTMVFFRRSDVISTGDIFVTTSYPIVDLARGGNIQGVIDGLNRIIELSIPADEQEGGTMIIPGHGSRRGLLPGDGYDHQGPRPGHGEQGNDARTGEGGQANARLRSTVWQEHGFLDDRHVCRGGVQKPEPEEVSRETRPGEGPCGF